MLTEDNNYKNWIDSNVKSFIIKLLIKLLFNFSDLYYFYITKLIIMVNFLKKHKLNSELHKLKKYIYFVFKEKQYTTKLIQIIQKLTI